jgi:hypothetical protein
MADATTTATDSGCGCCQPEPKTAQAVIDELLARRARVDERLQRLEPVGARR